MDMLEYILLQAKNGTSWNTQFNESKNYKFWKATLDIKTCPPCRDNHGKIWLISEKVNSKPLLHPNCRCNIIPLGTIKAGTATSNKTDGVDWFLKYKNNLPDYYISNDELEELGWKVGKKLQNLLRAKCYIKVITIEIIICHKQN